MANSYRPVDRDQAFLLPPNMADWLPEGHLAWFLIDAVKEMDTAAFHAGRARSGQGRAAYDPDMLVTLLLYAYAHKVHSSRQIERLCTVDVAFRVICAQDVPDHSTISTFRREHEAAFKALFEQVLMLCARAGLGRVGSIAVDGTKIAANASIDANRTEEKLRAEVERIVAEAVATDAAEDAVFGDARGDELPPSMSGRGGGRQARIRDCLAQLETETAQRTATQATADAKVLATLQAARDRVERAEDRARAAVRDYQARCAATGRHPGGRPPVAVDDSKAVQAARARLVKAEQRHAERDTRLRAQQQAAAKKPSKGRPRRNVTDPDSRIMPTRKGWIQGYNAQLAVTDDHLILAATLTQDTIDTDQCVPMITAALNAAALVEAHRPAPAGRGDPHPHHGIDLILFDAGYLSNDNLAAPGPDRLIALGKHRDQARAATTHPTSGPPPADATAIDQMRHRLQTPQGHQAYKRRGATVETVIGHLKDLIGLRTFSRRGLQAATSELHLAAAATNILKLHRTTTCTT
ncbi:transposase [Kribbella sp. VKM Ac-2500]|uniref:transposase n=1 Tax=Kribbella sp. VKM Ac-2500 TaxID=2512214 RepID=UPI00104A4D9B|nr:transposase [Kribbella sp. VKM Ac-2500]TCN25890.1 transposase [Kribbella sp. VKM Ac-2500]